MKPSETHSLSDRVAIRPLWDSTETPFQHTWSGIVNVDQFRWLARADVLRLLAAARDEIGARHVRAAAMYSPEMAVWDYDIEEWRLQKAEKKPRANWQLVDLSIEGLMDLGLKPVYTTCFTPVGMTDDPCVCWPDRNPTGMPRDLRQWADFVSGGLRHHVQRYGRREVRSWYIECWNEPNLQGCFFGGTKEDFFRLWDATFHAVKSVDPDLRFGGPSTARGEWIPEFLDWTKRSGTQPDYLISHVYNNDSAANPVSPFDGPASHRVGDSPHFAAGVIRGVRRKLSELGFSGEVHWNEWGRSWFLHDPRKETALEAAFIAHTMADSSQAADKFAFWCLSDIYNQGGFQSAEFQGNYGMASLHGLRKPAWWAHVLLGKLGTGRIPIEADCNELIRSIATKERGRIAILVSALHQNPDGHENKLRVHVELPASSRSIRAIRLGKEENNIIATWRSRGANPSPSPAEIAELRRHNSLKEVTASDMVRDARGVEVTMERPGVLLIEAELA